MRLLLYAGPAPWRDLVFQFSAPLVAQATTDLTLVTSASNDAARLLSQAVDALAVPSHVKLRQEALPGGPREVLLNAAREQPYDLVILGRLHRRLARLLPGPRSKAIAQHLEPSVLRVHGLVRPIRHILLASGGDHHTMHNARVVAQFAAPLRARITLLHILSQEQICFELIPDTRTAQEDFPHSDMPESRILRETVELLHERGIEARQHIRIGPVIDEVIAEVSNGCYDLLVVGQHQASDALEHLLFEDITGALLDSSPLPVLVVKGQDSASR